MISFPTCKINIGLQVLNRRADGYHDISTIFYPVPWNDILEIVPSGDFKFTATGLEIPGNHNSNLCIKAYELLRRDYPVGPVHIHLHKIIPMGAGLGGGSSDGAFTLRMLNQIFQLKLTPGQLGHYAAQLGSDCAFFLHDGPMLGQGRGEVLSPLDFFLKGRYLILVIPEIHVPTAEAYRGVHPVSNRKQLTSLIAEPMKHWKTEVENDFEITVFDKHPVIRELKETMYGMGANFASMSGSGSSVFGIFDEETDREQVFNGLPGWAGWL